MKVDKDYIPKNADIPKNPLFKDLTGLVINKITVLSYEGQQGYKSLWLCQCECGQPIISRGDRLEKTVSCGCYKNQSYKNVITHGLSYHPLYPIWKGIRYRCTNINSIEYKNYGGRGIKMCEEWLNNPQSFFDFIGERPTKEHSIDRIDNDGNYEPGNVRWATSEEQGNNRRDNYLIEYNGEIKTLAQLSKEYQLKYNTLWFRLKNDWNLEESLNSPQELGLCNKKAPSKEEVLYLEYNGEKLTIPEWTKKLGFCRGIIRGRINTGWSIEDALTKPVRPRKKVEVNLG